MKIRRKHPVRVNHLGSDPIPQLVRRLALPAMLAQFVNVLYSIIDRMYIGNIANVGDIALAGVGICGPIVTMISAFAAWIGNGGAPLLSIKSGEQNKEGASAILANCFVLLIGIAVCLTIGAYLCKDALLVWFGATERIFPYAEIYMRIYLIGTVFAVLSLGLNQFIICQGFSNLGMVSVIIGAVLNILLDPLFIFVLHMGVRGAAVATVLSQAVSAAWVLRFLTGKTTVLRLRRSTLRIDTKLLLPAVSLGASPFVMQSTESLLTVAFNISLQKYGGDLAVGAMTILTSVAQMIQLPLTGLAQGAQPILSYNFGAHRPDRMKQVVRYNILIAVLFAVSIWGVVQLAPHAVVHLFTSDEQLTEITVWALRIYMALGFTNAFQTGFQQSFVALGEAKISLFLALERKIFLLIPLIFILPHFFADKLFAVFLAEPVADVLAAATTTVLFLIRFRKITNEM